MHSKNFYCFECRHVFPLTEIMFECADCGGPLDIEYDYSEIKKNLRRKDFLEKPISHWKYAAFLPITRKEKIVSLKEGNTPLIKSVSQENVFFKFEGLNPTGSFKDRGSTVEISKALELGIKQVYCASTGNMGASIAAYCARAGIRATIVVPEMAEDRKVKQMIAHNARVKKISGDYTDALNLVRRTRKQKHAYLVGDYPFRGEGEKSVGFEIAEQLGWKTPKQIICPMGNGTLVFALFKAFRELKTTGFVKSAPRMIGVQAENCAPIAKAFDSGKGIQAIRNPKTIATAIACGNPVDGIMALHALKKSNGCAVTVPDKETLVAQKALARQGIYAEPSGAIAFAALKKTGAEGTTIAIVTGHGLKSDF